MRGVPVTWASQSINCRRCGKNGGLSGHWRQTALYVTVLRLEVVFLTVRATALGRHPGLPRHQMRRGETMPRAQKRQWRASARPPSSNQPHCTADPPGGGAAVGGPSSAAPTASPMISARLCPGRHA